MGLFGLGKKKEWDIEKSNANKEKMRELFNQTVENGEEYQIAYGFGLNIKNSDYLLAKKTTYQYTSLIIGYREKDMTIAMVQTTPELEGCSDAEFFEKEHIKKAKITTGMYTIYHEGGIMAGYTQFGVVEENDEEYLVYVEQEKESKDFSGFFKKFSQK